MADITSTLNSWSSTAASNLPANSAAVGPNTLADNQRVIQAVVRAALAGDGTIASSTTTDLSTVNDGDITVTGTTTITGLGTLTAGIKKVLTFSGALTLTHNATSLILPGAANITTAAGDVAIMRSLGSGNWKCVAFQPAAGNAKVGSNADITSLTGLTTALSVAQGGTASTTAAAARTALSAAASGANADITSMTALTTINRTGGTSIKGINTNTAAAAGDVGEYIESFAGPVSAPASNTYGDITSITLTAGDWDISAIAISILNTGVSAVVAVSGFCTASGTSSAGMTFGDTGGYSSPPTLQYSPTITIPPKRVSINATTTYYLKMWMSYASGTPQFQGRISARRVR